VYVEHNKCKLTVSWWTALVGVHVNGKNQLNSSMDKYVCDHHRSTPRRQRHLCHVESKEHRHHYTHHTHYRSVYNVVIILQQNSSKHTSCCTFD